jgi:hypothetical protein
VVSLGDASRRRPKTSAGFGVALAMDVQDRSAVMAMFECPSRFETTSKGTK